MISYFPIIRKEITGTFCKKQEQVIIPTIDSLHIEEKRRWFNKLLSQQNNDTIKKLQQTDKS
jgi:hypothetical protein